MQEVSLMQILEAREARVLRQRCLLERYHSTLISFTMNIPGPVKNSPLIRRAFRFGCRELECRLTGILHRELTDAPTGCEALYAVEGDADTLKALCVAIEEETPLGRLFDMDVLDGKGGKRSRETDSSRGCIVCGAPGRGCASRRLHSVPELQQAVRTLMTEHFARRDPVYIGALAREALLEEVAITPKPGLVDRANSGSHRDMDSRTFTASANALEPYFRECAAIGMATAGLTPAETFVRLQKAGLRAEEAMLRATGGVNTHKGAIYTLGLLCGGFGRLWSAEKPVPDIDSLLRACAGLARASLDQVDRKKAPETAGERLFRELGLPGIRGEAAAGLPAVAETALPVYRACLAEGRSPNDAGAISLLHLIARVEDTNLYHRGGPEGAAWAKQAATSLLPRPAMAEIAGLDREFIQRNLSPGGCADLLAAAIFLHRLETAADL